MNKLIEKIIKILKKRKWYIGVMESCTGGAIANSITNIPGVSDVFKEGKITYSDESKIKAGVNKEIIKKYGVYSIEVAEEMSKKIKGEVGIGVTGNLPGMVYIAIKINSKIKSEKIELKSFKINKIMARKEMKREVLKKIFEKLEQELA